jgi:DNA-binding response OmpR family regulator
LLAERTPGGHRRVEREDLIGFLQQHHMRTPPGLAVAPPTILVVDDELEVAQWIGKTLSEKCPEFRILLANNGFAAGKLITAEPPDLMILDLYMPGLDGFEVCRNIKGDPQTKSIKIVAVTAHPSPEAEKAVREAGAEDYMPKPLDVDRLASLISTLLRRRR